MFRCITIAFVLTVFMCCTPERSQELSKEEIEKIKATMQAYRQAWINNDSATVLNTISTDIVLFVRVPIQQFWEKPN